MCVLCVAKLMMSVGMKWFAMAVWVDVLRIDDDNEMMQGVDGFGWMAFGIGWFTFQPDMTN